MLCTFETSSSSICIMGIFLQTTIDSINQFTFMLSPDNRQNRQLVAMDPKVVERSGSAHLQLIIKMRPGLKLQEAPVYILCKWFLRGFMEILLALNIVKRINHVCDVTSMKVATLWLTWSQRRDVYTGALLGFAIKHQNSP